MIIVIKSSIFENNSAGSFGGAVLAKFVTVHILNSSFKENHGKVGGGAIYLESMKKVVINSSSFESNTVLAGGSLKSKAGGGAIQIEISEIFGSYQGGTHNIFNSSFQGNRAGESTYAGGGAIALGRVKFMIKSSSFENNTCDHFGGAIHMRFSNGRISMCTFRNNKAYDIGGAVCQHGNNLILEQSLFQNNTAFGKMGQGGALYLQQLYHNYSTIAHVNIFHSVFDGNHASYRGGAIFASSNKLYIQNSTFISSSYPHPLTYFGGDFLYSRSKVTLKSISFLDVDRYNFQNSLIIHETLNTLIEKGINKEDIILLLLSLRSKIQIKCFTGKNVAISNGTYSHNPNKFFFMSISCSFCSQNYYSLQAAHLDLFSQNYPAEITNVKCYHCPLGGVCQRGHIRASNNFWGYVFNNQIYFASCPFGYCCFKEECVNYSSCHTSRTGILCGHCEKGFTENLLTQDCLPPGNCRHPWYLLVVMIIGIVYVGVLMYISEITKAFTALLIPTFFLKYLKSSKNTTIRVSEVCKRLLKILKSKFPNVFNRGCEMQYMTDDVQVPNSETEEPFLSSQENFQLVSDEEMQSIVASLKADNEEDVFPGLLKIVIFFYQTNVLFRIYSGSQTGGFIHALQEAISTLFNLRTDGTYTQDLHWCPVHNLRPVSKVLLKSSFIIYLFFLLLLVFILCKTGKLLNIVKGTNLNNSRLLCCILRLVFISYSGITMACFSLLPCVQLGYLGKVLFIDGSISCYQWW